MTATLTRTGRPEALIPLARREARECLAEDLRRLDADEIYFEALEGHRQGAVRAEHRSSKPMPTAATLVTAAGDRLIGAITDGHRDRGAGRSIVLTGGGTGIGLLEHVGDHGGAIDWSKVHLFWGDERYVPADDDERNDKQAREALLDHIDIPAGQRARDAGQRRRVRRRHRRRGARLRAGAGRQRRRRRSPTPAFDVHLLGMGGEGHINSLFPHTAAVRETDPPGGRRHRLPQAAAAANHLDAARGSALARGLAGGRGRGEGRGGGGGGRRRGPRSTCPRPVRSGARRRCGCSTKPPRQSCQPPHTDCSWQTRGRPCAAPAPAGERIKTLTQAALNADVTVEQVDALLGRTSARR